MASPKCPILALAITGIETDYYISLINFGSDILAIPPLLNYIFIKRYNLDKKEYKDYIIIK